MQGSYKDSDNPHIWIKNPTSFLKIKRELGNIARSRQMTLSQLCRTALKKLRDEAPIQERNYEVEED